MSSIIVLIAIGVIFYYLFKSTEFQRKDDNSGKAYGSKGNAGYGRNNRQNWNERSSWSQDGALGSLLNMIFNGRSQSTMGRRPYSRQANFHFCLLVLAAEVMKADGKVLRSELNYVKAFLLRNFGERKSLQMIQTLREILNQEYDLRAIARQIGTNMDYHSRLQLMQFLFGIASADGSCSYKETEVLKRIATNLFLNQSDYESLYAMFVGSSEDMYKILELDRSASDGEVKKAYHKMALKYHPDRVAHLGEEIKRSAELKFQKLTEAYEKIKKERGIK